MIRRFIAGAGLTLLFGSVSADETRPTSPLSESVALRVGNTAHRTSDRQWDWWIFLEGSDDALKQVDCVHYFLHSSFPEPIQEVCDRDMSGGKGFMLPASGWGTFTVNVKIAFKDKSVRSLQHDLSFRPLAVGWLSLAADEFDSEIAVPVTAAQLRQGSFQFRFALKRTTQEDLNVRLESIAVHQDGSTITTPWTFDILLNGQRLLYLGRRQYHDLRKPTVVSPTKRDVAKTTIKSTPSLEIRILGYQG